MQESFIPEEKITIGGKEYKEKYSNPAKLETMVAEIAEERGNVREMVDSLARGLVWDALEAKGLTDEKIEKMIAKKEKEEHPESEIINQGLKEERELTEKLMELSSDEMVEKVLEFKDLEGAEGKMKRGLLLAQPRKKVIFLKLLTLF